MEHQMTAGVAKVVAFANGLRKNTAAAGARWTRWPRGARDVAMVIACIDGIRGRLQAAAAGGDGEAEVAACIADLRAILEWTTYQSANIATARAVVAARKTKAFAERFGLLDDPTAKLSILLDAEESLIGNVRTKNDYMTTLAARHPHLGLPRPLIDPIALAPKIDRKPGKLALIQRLTQSSKGNSYRR
jgi:hypothetical protein